MPPTSKENRIDGLSFVAPPRAFQGNPMVAVKNAHAEWISVIPYAYTKVEEPSVLYGQKWQWWGEKEEGIRETIKLAHQAGLKIMLKPQVYIPGSWPGDLDFKEEEWKLWEADYTLYVMTYVKIAAESNVELFCIGTEFKIHEQRRSDFWLELIQKIRAIYKGKLVYAANWDCFDKTPFWASLDYIGINAYFPLSDQKTPSIEALKEQWKEHKPKIKAIYDKYKKPILFTEYGYLSTDYCAGKTWELEAKVNQLAINHEAQANALAALYQSFQKEPYWQGGFLWKWFPEMKGHEGYPERDYTPQGKKSIETLRLYFDK